MLYSISMKPTFFFSWLLYIGCDTSSKNGGDENTVNNGDIVDDTGNSTNPDTQQDRDLDGDGYLASEECDDGNTLINPSMPEVCDGIDNNCDGQVDEGVTNRYYADQDLDGFGNNEVVLEGCTAPSGYVTIGNDCDDSNEAIFPSASEECNDIDDDCDGEIDENLSFGLYLDLDGDGHGDPNQPSTDCQNTEGYVFYDDDCDDTNPNVYTGAVEDPTDGLDNNCNGDIDEGFAIETIATGLSYTDGQPITIDVDSYGFVHIAYENNGDIEYVNNASGGWSSAQVAPTDASASSGMHLKGQVDGLDRFHISYISSQGSGHDVNYMYVNTINGNWSSENTVNTVTSGTLDPEFRLDMDVDNNNLPSIAWFDQTDETPWILDASSVNPLSGTETQMDDNCSFGFCAGYTGSYISLAIDNSNTNHTVFYNNVVGQENQYNQVTNQGSSPTCGTFTQPNITSIYIEESGDGINNDIAIRPYANKPGVAYQDGSTSQLMYATTGGNGCGVNGWTPEIVDGSNAGDYISLEYTSTDNPYIAYYAAQTADLKLAFFDGASWIYESVDTYGNIGKFVDMTIDSNDMVHIVYYDATTGSVKYAFGQL